MSVLFASADRAPATYTADFTNQVGRKGVLVYINYTAEGGASSTLDAKLQYWDEAEQAWDDLPNCSFAQFTGVSESDLMVYPGIAEVANRQISIALPKKLRLSATVGTTNVTFSAAFTPLE